MDQTTVNKPMLGFCITRKASPAATVSFAVATALSLALTITGCGAKPPPAATSAEGTVFVAQLNNELREMSLESAAAQWIAATYITQDSQLISARAQERSLELFSRKLAESRRFDGVQLAPTDARALQLLRQGESAPAPDDAAKRAELAQIMTRMEATYGAGKYCQTSNGKEVCHNIDDVTATMASSRNYDELLAAWNGWHTISRPMRADYARFVELANEGAREIGYEDLGQLWRDGYDMTPEAFNTEVERLWDQVKPLYDSMHCFARTRLARKYGEDKVPAGKPIPAHLFGNIWAQQWNNIYADILKPFPNVPAADITTELVRQKYDAVRMTKQAESFYTSLGMPALPESFWERSMLVRPRDRDVVCHASAWQMDAS
ncbi:MAG: M2 family metallopeptidase, partial [Nevskiaceae bacterium]|nr:M2 family metallopeptidase [Nevskiaceae bacterium]